MNHWDFVKDRPWAVAHVGITSVVCLVSNIKCDRYEPSRGVVMGDYMKLDEICLEHRHVNQYQLDHRYDLEWDEHDEVDAETIYQTPNRKTS